MNRDSFCSFFSVLQLPQHENIYYSIPGLESVFLVSNLRKYEVFLVDDFAFAKAEVLQVKPHPD